MRYVLVDRYDNIVTTKDFKENVTADEAKAYFKKIKNINMNAFNQLWRVMTEERYHEISESFLRRPSSEGEFGDWLDYEKS